MNSRRVSKIKKALKLGWKRGAKKKEMRFSKKKKLILLFHLIDNRRHCDKAIMGVFHPEKKRIEGCYQFPERKVN